jgi:hypothetical protein
LKKPVTNPGASVRQRLLNVARQREEDFDLVLTRFALERLLYRLSVSPYAEQFVLKGAMLVAVWAPDAFRATRDLDLLGRGDVSPEALAAASGRSARSRRHRTASSSRRRPFVSLLRIPGEVRPVEGIPQAGPRARRGVRDRSCPCSAP